MRQLAYSLPLLLYGVEDELQEALSKYEPDQRQNSR
jgi:hypothetical protein